MANLGTLSVSLTANSTAFRSGLASAQQNLNQFSRDAQSQLTTTGVAVGSMIGNIAANAVTSAFGAAMNMGRSVFSLGEHFITTAASAEQLRIQINVLAGSVEEGSKLFADLERFAIATSFSFEDVAAQARTFMALGIKNNEVVDTMTLIGTLAMGDTERMRLLGKAYTDTMSKGTLRAQEFNQFAENNVNVMAALMAATGKSRQELIQMREDGKITFNDLHNALVGITTGQGQFAGLLDAMMQTTSGRWQAFQERLDQISRQFGEKLLPYANKFLDWLDASMPKLERFASKSADATIALVDKMISLADVMDNRVLPAFMKIEKSAERILAGPAQMLGGLLGAAGGVGNVGGLQGRLPGPLGGRPDAAAPGGGVGNINPIAPGAGFMPPVGGGIGLAPFNLLGELGNQTEMLLGASKAMTVDWSNMEPEKPKDRAQGFLAQGSQEAFSAIVNAMRGGKDPVVQATNNVAAAIKNDVGKPLKEMQKDIKGNFNILVAEKM